jgi:hypothetical protein
VSVFDLIFIGSFLGAVGYVFWILSLLLRRRWTGVRRHAIRWTAMGGAYLLVVVLVGRSSGRRILATDELLRYDDWCLGVQKATFATALGETHPETGKRFLVVTLKASSTARRVQAAPKGALVYVIDDADTRYDVAEQPQMAFEKLNGPQPGLTVKLESRGSFLTTRVFEVPQDAREFFLGHRHGTGSRFPGMFIIGTGFHKAPAIRLQIDSDR